MAKDIKSVSDDDEHLIALLTPEEIAGMKEGDDFDESGEFRPDQISEEARLDKAAKREPETVDNAEQQAANEDEDNVDEANLTPEQQAEVDAEAAAQAALDAETAAAAEVEDDDDGFGKNPSMAMNATLPDDYNIQLKAVKDAQNELEDKYENGDILGKEYRAARDELNEKYLDLRSMKTTVENQRAMRYDNWQNVTVATFLDIYPEYRSNPVLLRTLDREVKEVQAIFQNEGKLDTDPEILRMAHKAIVKALPGTFKKAAAKVDEDKNPKLAPDGKSPAFVPPKTKKSVPSIAKMPASDTQQTEQDKFANLDSLKDKHPLQYESKLAQLRDTDPMGYREYMES